MISIEIIYKYQTHWLKILKVSNKYFLESHSVIIIFTPW